MTQEVLKLSQEALAGLKDVERQVRELVAENKALKEALAKEKALQALRSENERLGLYKDAYAEPVAWVVYSSAENDIVWADKGKLLKQNTPLYTTPPQRTEQEPVAWMDADGKTFPFVWNVSSLGVRQGSKYLDESLTPLYTRLPQRPWVGLTDEEIDNLWESTASYYNTHDFARAIEAKLKELNT